MIANSRHYLHIPATRSRRRILLARSPVACPPPDRACGPQEAMAARGSSLRQACVLLALVLLAAAGVAAAVTPNAARKLLDASEPPLVVKSRGCFSSYPDVPLKIAEDIAAVDAYAAANGRQRLTYAGAVSDLTAELGSFDMLIVYTWACWAISEAGEVFSAAEQAALQTALATGTLKKLMVWNAWNDAGIDNRVPGISNVGCSDWKDVLVYNLNYISASPALYASVGPNPPSSNHAIYGNDASHAGCPASGVQALNNGVAHAWDTNNVSSITAFSHCYQGRGAVFYSQMPIDFHLFYPNSDYARMREFHANAISVFTNDISCAGPPTCPADVVLSATWLPPNNKMFDVSLTSVPLQDPALPGNVTVNSVEFFDVLKGRRPTFPLAVTSPGSSVVSLRAERNGAGSGRLYRIKYTAANAAGSCDGVAFVCVPHDASAFNPLVNATTIADLAAAGPLSAPLAAAVKVTCPMPGSIAEAQWMRTTGP